MRGRATSCSGRTSSPRTRTDCPSCRPVRAPVEPCTSSCPTGDLRSIARSRSRSWSGTRRHPRRLPRSSVEPGTDRSGGGCLATDGEQEAALDPAAVGARPRPRLAGSAGSAGNRLPASRPADPRSGSAGVAVSRDCAQAMPVSGSTGSRPCSGMAAAGPRMANPPASMPSQEIHGGRTSSGVWRSTNTTMTTPSATFAWLYLAGTTRIVK
jgi:hypothetical protein